jgi:hypothetical protein
MVSPISQISVTGSTAAPLLSAWCHPSLRSEPGVEWHYRSLRQNSSNTTRLASIHCPIAATVLRQIVGWFDDYKESHLHSGLGMIASRGFIRAQAK